MTYKWIHDYGGRRFRFDFCDGGNRVLISRFAIDPEEFDASCECAIEDIAITLDRLVKKPAISDKRTDSSGPASAKSACD